MNCPAADGQLQAWSDDDFGAMAREVFSWQFELCQPYRGLCERRGITPSSVSDWREIPAVPSTAFKYFDFVSVPDDSAGEGLDALFETSGTTQGSERRVGTRFPGPASTGPLFITRSGSPFCRMSSGCPWFR